MPQNQETLYLRTRQVNINFLSHLSIKFRCKDNENLSMQNKKVSRSLFSEKILTTKFSQNL